MENNSVKIWMRAFRIFSLTASLIPVVLGGLLGFNSGTFNGLTFGLAIAALITLQIGANLLNDSDDFTNKVDTKESFNSSGVIVEALLENNTVKLVSYFFFFIAFVLGVYPAINGGLILWVIALLGIGGAYFYTRKPFQFKYKGAGLPLIFLMFGPLPVFGAYYLQAKDFDPKVLIYSFLIGILTTSILHGNDIRDIESDSKAGIKTGSILLGEQVAKKVYVVMISSVYLILIVSVVAKLLPLICLLPFITLPIAIKNMKASLSPERESILNLDRDSAQLQLLFGILLIISVIISNWR